MIVIVGETHDDILYFDSVLANRREDIVLNRYKISIGTIFSQDVLIVHELFTSVVSSAILTLILKQYNVYLVISVGRCMSITKPIKNGDIVVSKKVIDVNVDLTMFNDVAMAQIPGFERDFAVQNDILTYISQGLDRRLNVYYHSAIYLSTDNMSKEVTDALKERKAIFALENENIVIDHNSAGVALASYLQGVPFIVVKVAENNLSQVNNLETYSHVLSKYIDLGKAVISTINDIGRSDILEGTGEQLWLKKSKPAVQQNPLESI